MIPLAAIAIFALVLIITCCRLLARVIRDINRYDNHWEKPG